MNAHELWDAVLTELDIIIDNAAEERCRQVLRRVHKDTFNFRHIDNQMHAAVYAKKDDIKQSLFNELLNDTIKDLNQRVAEMVIGRDAK